MVDRRIESNFGCSDPDIIVGLRRQHHAPAGGEDVAGDGLNDVDLPPGHDDVTAHGRSDLDAISGCVVVVGPYGLAMCFGRWRLRRRHGERGRHHRDGES